MAKEHFKDWNPQPHTIERLAHVHTIIAEYKAQGLTLSLRQIFYQFVARELIENNPAGYQAIKELMIRARESGKVDWDDMEDRNREFVNHSSWDDPAQIIEGCADQYQEDWLQGQPFRVEVLIEKSALVGVIDSVCREFQVPYLSMRGNNSITMLYTDAKRYADYIEQGLHPVVLLLADHDPAGYFMPLTVEQRLSQVARHPIEVRRIGLNLVQVRQYKPPPNNLKEKDSRHPAYVKATGVKEGWELDALEPSVISRLIREEVEDRLDHEAWSAAMAQSADNRAVLVDVAERWHEIGSYLGR